MKKKAVSIILTTALGATIFTPTTNFATPGPNIEKGLKGNAHSSPSSVHPVFSWDQPGPSSPVLHPGSIRGAGMRAEPLKKIDNLLQNAIEDKVMPGAVAYVARRGHIVKQQAYGYALKYKDDNFTESENPIPMKEDTIFDLASISKIFTTTAAMILYEDGKFKLNDPVAKHIPEFAANGKEDVTIEQLMTHTSGFKPWIPLYTVEGDRNDRLQHVFQHPLENEPGSTYTYSDLNMITLGALVERLSGMRLDEFVKQEITAPLHMNDTMYNPDDHLKHRIAATEEQPWANRGLVWGEVHDESAWSLDGVAGHAGVFSTASDLAKLAHMFLMDGEYGNKRILKPETVQLLTENRIPEFPGDNHGLGWELHQGWYMDALSSPGTYGHTGYTGTSIVVNPANDTIAILLTNRVHPTRETVSTSPTRREFARKVADAIPVQMDKKAEPWHAGYGDHEEKHLIAEIEPGDASLSFNTWHEMEDSYDLGELQVSKDGETWTTLETYTGDSNGWVSKNVPLPSDTTHIRFTYKTDGSVNSRGWYVDQLKWDGKEIEPSSDSWQKRSY
ncbi:CubicO group peptidase, beta-lactamase class C family [Halobacillus karajensis]|uniref:serine hydrolase domain-containing protein n=1 Tax=Halobacillus karajensis TaxID=195088 RepID=UPI0008A7D64F|nr:serine hydrolase domain-containing protein [Halobacillus karajensis]SEH98055.1 CubicO group peptidase, beta-lactamase class C family [Halobacillus karajensis]